VETVILLTFSGIFKSVSPSSTPREGFKVNTKREYCFGDYLHGILDNM